MIKIPLNLLAVRCKFPEARLVTNSAIDPVGRNEGAGEFPEPSPSLINKIGFEYWGSFWDSLFDGVSIDKISNDFSSEGWDESDALAAASTLSSDWQLPN